MSWYPSKPITIPINKIPNHEKVIKVLKEFKRMNPWKGSPEERYEKFKWLHEKLNEIYGLSVRFVSEVRKPYTFSGNSYYDPYSKTITLMGRYSVITFLHEWGHALDLSPKWHNKLPMHGEYWAVAFSVTLFKHVFPEKYARLRSADHCLIRK